MTLEPEIKTDTKEPLILRCIRACAGVDWKAMAIVLAALGGFGGAVWNKIDSIVEKTMVARTQQGVYDLLAQRMDNMDKRLGEIETVLVKKTASTELGSKEAQQVKAVAVMTESAGTKAPPMPTFEQVKQSALSDRMPELLDAVSVQ